MLVAQLRLSPVDGGDALRDDDCQGCPNKEAGSKDCDQSKLGLGKAYRQREETGKPAALNI